MVHNDDGLLDIPESLMPKPGSGKQKYLRMVVLTKEEKIQAKIALGELRMERAAAAQEKLKRALEESRLKA